MSPDVSDASSSPVVRERRVMLMAAAMAYVHYRLRVEPKPGHDIAALLAWNVEDVSQTPEFVFERNRNYIQQGELYHAEANVLRRAYQRRRTNQLLPEGAQDEALLARLRGATVYATLEPCPMCATTIQVAGVARAYYCVDDPGLRDRATRQSRFYLPRGSEGAGLESSRSESLLCEAANERVWAAVKAANGVRLTQLLAEDGDALFGPFRNALEAWRRPYPQNVQLLANLQLAVRHSTTDQVWRRGAERALKLGDEIGDRLGGRP